MHSARKESGDHSARSSERRGANSTGHPGGVAVLAPGEASRSSSSRAGPGRRLSENWHRQGRLFPQNWPDSVVRARQSGPVSAYRRIGNGCRFGGGRRRSDLHRRTVDGQYRAARSEFDQAKFQYLQVTLRAFQEVSDALLSQQKLTELELQQKRQVLALSDSAAIANRRYCGGLASYYEVLEAQQLLFPAELALSLARRDRLLAIVQLYKALGGGWKLTDTQWPKDIPEVLEGPVSKVAR